MPTGLPGRDVLAYAWGGLLLIGGFGFLLKRTAAPAAFLLTVNLLILALLRIPQALPAPFSVGAWLGVCEGLAMTCGCWILFISLVARGDKLDLLFVADDNGMRVARFLFGASCLVFGLSHFAAGLGILFAIVPRLAAALEALMMSSFVLLVHVPSVVVKPAPSWAPTSGPQWTMLFIASTLAAAEGWSRGRSVDYRGGWVRRRRRQHSPDGGVPLQDAASRLVSAPCRPFFGSVSLLSGVRLRSLKSS